MKNGSKKFEEYVGGFLKKRKYKKADKLILQLSQPK